MRTDKTNKQNIDSFAVTGDWAKQSTRLKETFPQLTDADLAFEVGKEHDLLARMQSRLGRKRDELVDLLRRGQVALTPVIA